nr:unnamed protein product [Callosobruchus analis]
MLYLKARKMQKTANIYKKRQASTRKRFNFLDENWDESRLMNRLNKISASFVDFGDENRRASFADHAILFMVKGIRRKCK